MRIIKFIQAGEIVQLGFEGKVLYLKSGLMLKPMKLGELKDIKKLANERTLNLHGKEQKVSPTIKKMAQGITSSGLLLASKYTNEEFYNDFLNDYKEMNLNGELKFLGEFTEWA